MIPSTKYLEVVRTLSAGAAIQHARANSLGSSTAASYYVPESCVSDLSVAKAAFESLDGHAISMDITAMKVGDTVELPQSQFRVFAFPTVHRVPSQGYCIVMKHKGELLPEYAGAEPSSFKRLRKAGVEPFRTFETCELAYTGDTTFAALLEPGLEFIFTVPVLVVEMTYLDGDRSKATDRGHIHLDDFLEHEHLFQNQHIIFVHLSEKYKPHTRALRILRERIPGYLHHRVGVCLRSFGASEDISYLFPTGERATRVDPPSSGGRPQRTFAAASLSVQPTASSSSHSETKVLCAPCMTKNAST